jgi:hypothetical protein
MLQPTITPETGHDSPLSPWQALSLVCHNEQFPSYRDFEIPLGIIARALWTGKIALSFSQLQDWDTTALRRAGYLLQLLCGLASDAIYDRYWPIVTALRQAVPPSPEPMPFYHADRPGGHDEVAALWGLSRGLNLARLLK